MLTYIALFLNLFLTVQSQHGAVKNSEIEHLRVARLHFTAEQLPGRGGIGFVRMGLQQHTDKGVRFKTKGKVSEFLIVILKGL